MDVWTDEWMGGCVEKLMRKWKDGWMGKRMDG
jgi:hypothetical protein